MPLRTLKDVTTLLAKTLIKKVKYEDQYLWRLQSLSHLQLKYLGLNTLRRRANLFPTSDLTNDIMKRPFERLVEQN